MSFDPEQITFFAKTDARGQQVPFGIKAKDRTKHVYVIGKTGMGKSTLLENMAVQDMKNGNGLAFIDPHGATAEVLLDYIPEDRVKDVLYFAPFDTANPMSFNVMEDVGPDKRHLVVSGLMSVFKKIWVDAWSARMEYILSNTLLALLEYPDSTLLGVNRMLSDKHYRKAVVDNIKDPAVKSFWVDEFANYSERYMQEAGDAIKNKIGQFTSNPLIRNIVGQPHSSFDIRELMDERKIIIANLSKGLVGESNANLLGSMLTTRIYLAAMSRADLSSEQLKTKPNFYFYVDEFQSFANATFADILSEARKYKLNLTIAHQYIEQMEEEVRNAVFGNVGTIIAFRVGPFDAEVLETVFTPRFTAADIVNLGFAQIYLSLMIDGIGSAPFSAVTLPPIAPSHTSYKEMAIAESRRRYAAPRAGVEESINHWHEKNFAPTPVPRESVTQGSSSGGSKDKSREAGVRERTGSSVGEKKPVRRDDASRASKDERPKKREETIVSKGAAEQQEPSLRERAPEPKVSVPRMSADRDMGDVQKERPRESTKGETYMERPKAPPRQQSVEELRALLRTIAAKDASPAKVVSAEEQPKSREDLKAALSAVVGKPVEELKISAETSPVAEVPPPVSQVPPLSPAVPASSPIAVNPYAEAKNKREPISPKQLERMMRVTGSDKNPLR